MALHALDDEQTEPVNTLELYTPTTAQGTIIKMTNYGFINFNTKLWCFSYNWHVCYKILIHMQAFLASFPGLPRLQFLIACSMGGRRPGESYHVIRGTHDVTGSRHEDIFTFISPATEKLEKQDKFQPRDKSHL